MANEIPIKRSVVGTSQLNRVVNRDFETFTKAPAITDNDTIEELFRLYDLLYYSIPIDGETFSHEYLIVESSKLKRFERDTQDIQPLLDEIAELRQQLLIAEQQILDLELQSEQIPNI